MFATGLALWALLLARTFRSPSTWRFAALGAGIALLVLVRPANQVLLPAVLAALLVPVAWRRRLGWSAACLAAAVAILGAWAVHNGVRYDDATVARGGRAWVPFLRVWLADKTVEPENGDASQRLADLIESEVLTEDPHARLDVPLDAYLENGTNYETVRLIALSDEVLGRGENYDVIFDSALEGIRESPGTYVRGVADTFWEFLQQQPLREDVAPREQTEPEAPAPTYESNGVVLPESAGICPRGRRAVRLRLVRLRLHRLVHARASRARVGRLRAAAALQGDRLAGSCLGRRPSGSRGRLVRRRDPEPDHAALPAAAVLDRARARRARFPQAA